MRSFRVSSVVRAAPEAVWARTTTIAGVKAELTPLARMTGEGEIGAGALGRLMAFAFELTFPRRHRRLRRQWR
jgi:ligand-binding SRPBCC domain-containing protein